MRQLSQRKADISSVSALEESITSQLRRIDGRINEIHGEGKAGPDDRVEQLESQLQVMGASMKQKVNEGYLMAAMEQQSSRINSISAGKACKAKVEALTI